MANAEAVGNPHLARASMDAATQERQDRFLSNFANFGTIRIAADATGIDRESVRWWRNNDVLGFAERFRAAQEAYADYLEHLAHERVTHPNGRTGSDILLIAMLNANRPDKYKRDSQPQQQKPQVVSIIINAPAVVSQIQTRVVEGSVSDTSLQEAAEGAQGDDKAADGHRLDAPLP